MVRIATTQYQNSVSVPGAINSNELLVSRYVKHVVQGSLLDRLDRKELPLIREEDTRLLSVQKVDALSRASKIVVNTVTTVSSWYFGLGWLKLAAVAVLGWGVNRGVDSTMSRFSVPEIGQIAPLRLERLVTKLQLVRERQDVVERKMRALYRELKAARNGSGDDATLGGWTWNRLRGLVGYRSCAAIQEDWRVWQSEYKKLLKVANGFERTLTRYAR